MLQHNDQHDVNEEWALTKPKRRKPNEKEENKKDKGQSAKQIVLINKSQELNF